MYEGIDLKDIIILRDELQERFDYLWEHHLNPLEMRSIGCRIIHLNNVIKEASKNGNKRN